MTEPAVLDNPARSLPVPLTPLVGREREVDAVRGLLAREGVRLVTLTGSGGVGKTRLALGVAGEMCADFVHDAHFVPLAPLSDPAFVGPAIAAALNIRETGDRPVRERLLSFLRDKHLLLVLDNFEHLLSSAPLVSELLAASPGLSVLATSRSRLRISGEHAFTVPPLAVPEVAGESGTAEVAQTAAVRLFVERARAVKPDFAVSDANLEAVGEIVCRLDGLPLAIELAAARSNVLSPQALLTRLERRLSLLTGGPRDQPARQQTLRDAIAWSHDLLAAENQWLFRCLAVFAGGFTLEAAEAVASALGGDGGDVLAGVASLVDVSLLVQRDQPNGTSRFSMLDTVREFALEQLEASGEANPARCALAQWCLNLAAETRPAMYTAEAGPALARLYDERNNLRAALAWARDQNEFELSLRLTGDYFWLWLRRLPIEGRTWLEQALAAPHEIAVAARAKALHALGTLLFWVHGDAGQAEPLMDECLALFRRVGDQRGIGEALFHIGHLARALGDVERAQRLSDEAAKLAEANGYVDLIAATRVNRGVVAQSGGDYQLAQQELEAALALLRSIEFTWSEAWTLLQLADLARQRDAPMDALRYSLEAAELWNQDGDAWATQLALRGAANAARDLRAFEAAARMLGATQALCEASGIEPSAPMQHDQDRILADVRIALGEERFAQGWTEGHASSPATAIGIGRALAVGSSAPVPVRTDLPGGLSDREAEVLRLAAVGLTNAEIADRLYLSPHTVRAHLHHIYTKLEINTRSEAVRYAIEHNLS